MPGLAEIPFKDDGESARVYGIGSTTMPEYKDLTKLLETEFPNAKIQILFGNNLSIIEVIVFENAADCLVFDLKYGYKYKRTL